MRKVILVLSLFFLSPVGARADCFIAQENGRILTQTGDCEKRLSPCSTFKIALSLMGFDSGILTDAEHPKWPFRKGYVDYLESWRHPQTPATWIKNSCVWYSQVLTPKLGLKKFKSYLTKFRYGDQDIAGDKGKNNGLTNCWLSSSLKISAKEQIVFLEKLINETLPISAKAQNVTKKLLFMEMLPNGWKLYGKTGSGNALKEDGTRDENRQIGWFIGWIEKGERKILFAQLIEDIQKVDESAGKRAKEMAKRKFLKMDI